MWYLYDDPWAAYGHLDNAFTADECDKIIKLSKSIELRDATVDDNFRLEKDYRKNQIGWVEPSAETNWIFRKITDIVTQSNSQLWKFDIETIPELQFTNYVNVEDQYKRHIDMGKTQHHRKLSFSIQLSDENDYEGCNLQFIQSEFIETAPRKRGSFILFPSFILHQVTPLISGERNALVGWVCGPKFK
tara:strand:- start:418 stop:984 length:567 start_codon:yes stop_codon:yes gene_type:complete